MKINTRTGLMGFLLALSTLNTPTATATSQDIGIKHQGLTIETRLSRLTAAIKERESQLQDSAKPGEDRLLAGSFANRFVNTNPWRNGWRDRGGFWNSGFRNGGFRNGGGFLNRY